MIRMIEDGMMLDPRLQAATESSESRIERTMMIERPGTLQQRVKPARETDARHSQFSFLCILIFSAVVIASCGPIKIDNPVAELSAPDRSPRVHRAAIDKMRAQPELSDQDLQILRALIHAPGYITEVREEALELLAERDLEILKETISFRLARLEAWGWRRRLSEIIAERGWTDLSAALARAWAYPVHGWVETEFDRPEYLALAKMHGPENVIDEVFNILLTTHSVAEQGLRTQVWTLLVRLGQRERLEQLLTEAPLPEDDGMLRDLRAVALDLSIFPVNREEILWARRLQQPEHALLREQAKIVVSQLPRHVRDELELRDLAILIAIANHEPELLNESKEQLYDRVDAHIRSTRRHLDSRAHDGYARTNNQTLREHRDQLTWGDLAAMLMAVRAMRVPEVVAHLFDFAERDRADKSTELGGIIRLDDQNRFEIIEYHPRVRFADVQFHATDEMIEAGYSAAFHFHFHAQKHNNAQFAGPGLGDLHYAENTRANCLVLTYVDRRTLNIDYYRHGRVVVDLGEVRR